MKKLLNLDDGWLAWIQNFPPQGNLGGGVDEVFDLEEVARRWLVDLGGSWYGLGVNTDSKFLMDWASSRAGRIVCIVMKAENWLSHT